MPGCNDCDTSGRRSFLRQLGGSVAAIMASLALTPVEARALPVALMQPSVREGGEVTYPLPEADGATIDLEQEVILVRWQNSIYAFNLSCPHQNTALKWQAGEHIFRCPRHKSEYQPDGTFIRGRATRGMDRFALRKNGTSVVVNLDALYRDDRDRDKWTAAVLQA